MDVQTVKRIAERATGSPTGQVVLLGKGATSVAWRVECSDGAVVVRSIPPGTDRPVTYQSEFKV